MKRLFLAALPFLLLFAGPARARGCDNAQSQNEMNQCAEDDSARADAALNAAYRKAMEGLSPEARDLLRAAQRDWIAYRDVECAYEVSGNEGGSIVPLIQFGCLARMSKARTEELGLTKE